jgi:hypothetical protein
MSLLSKIASNIFVGYGVAGLAFLILVMRIFYPHHRLVAVVVYLISWIPFVLSYYQKRSLFAQGELQVKSWLAQYWPHVGLLVGLLAFLYVLFVLFPLSSPLSKLSDDELTTQMDGDSAALVYLEQDMGDLIGDMESAGYFDNEAKVLLAEADEVHSLWSNFVGNAIEVDLIKNKYKGFAHINSLTRTPLHARAFFLSYGSFMTQYQHSLRLSQLVEENPTLSSMFNEGDENNAIPAGSYDAFLFQTTSPDSLIRLNAGRLYRPLLSSHLKKEKDLNAIVDRGLALVDSSLTDYPKLLVKNPLRFLEGKAFELWFPIQKSAALQTSYVRFTTRDYLLKPDFLQTHIDKFLPGDVFLERREWHATNAGIPGYWTHAALYVGSLDEMGSYFDGLEELGGETFVEYLKENFSKTYEQLKELDEDGFPFRIIEAKRPGVILNSLESSGGGDSLGVLRAKNINRSDRFKIVTTAMTHLGKGYDYNFDFSTDNQLVCSELVYKAYQHIEGIQLELQDFNGRLLLSPNSLAEKFDSELGTDEAELEFVLFLDGNEKTEDVVTRDAEAFRKSWQRPKWHIVKDHL